MYTGKNIIIKEEAYKMLKEIAAKEGLSLNEALEKCLKTYYNKIKSK